jgi:hypothetical protein
MGGLYVIFANLATEIFVLGGVRVDEVRGAPLGFHAAEGAAAADQIIGGIAAKQASRSNTDFTDFTD